MRFFSTARFGYWDRETVIDDEVVEAFLEDPENVYLSQATEMTEAAAESLSRYSGLLFLNGLTDISDAAAESLSKNEGSLGLNSKIKIAFESLNQFLLPKFLRGIRRIS